MNNLKSRLTVLLTLFFVSGAFLMPDNTLQAAELSVDDFTFEGPLGSQGANLEKIGKNHFKVTLGHAPQHSDWSNKLQFTITQNAKGNDLRLDVYFYGGDRYIFNEYFHSWSYDRKNWTPIHWEKKVKKSVEGDTFLFPTFEHDTVYVGHQVPMAYEDTVELIKQWQKSPYVTVHEIGKSLGGRTIHRISITDEDSPHPPTKRWVHYIANQHPGEHNSQWRMVGMVDWLLSNEARDARQRSICHFILMMSPDAPSKGWYRVNAQGVDMNRSYFANGADAEKQAHEAYLCQRDLEKMMASDTPVTDIWSMHTWGGIVEPICAPGPEMGTKVGPLTEFRDIMEANDTNDLIEPLKPETGGVNPTYWTDGPHQQFGVTVVLCEGAGAIYTKEENLESGEVIIKSLMEFYKGTKE